MLQYNGESVRRVRSDGTQSSHRRPRVPSDWRRIRCPGPMATLRECQDKLSDSTLTGLIGDDDAAVFTTIQQDRRRPGRIEQGAGRADGQGRPGAARRRPPGAPAVPPPRPGRRRRRTPAVQPCVSGCCHHPDVRTGKVPGTRVFPGGTRSMARGIGVICSTSIPSPSSPDAGTDIAFSLRALHTRIEVRSP